MFLRFIVMYCPPDPFRTGHHSGRTDRLPCPVIPSVDAVMRAITNVEMPTRSAVMGFGRDTLKPC